MTAALAEAQAAIDHAWARIEPAVDQALGEAMSDEARALTSLGLLARVAGLCIERVDGLPPGQARLADLADVDPDDALWLVEALANLRCEVIREDVVPTLVLRRRLS